MNKWVKAFLMLIMTGILSPLIKNFYDEFTTPITGSLVVAGVPENELAIIGAVPWIFPIFMFVWIIIMLSKPDEPKYPGGRF